MQERRVRLGDILDDYCPRERRITNHAVVAIVEDDVKQTRCTTCDADHVYKHGKMPASRRKKSDLLAGDLAALAEVPAGFLSPAVAEESAQTREPVIEPRPVAVEAAEVLEAVPLQAEGAPVEAEPDADAVASERDEDWPVHRRLIRATLPRPEGQTPERQAPDFFHQTGGRNDRQRPGNNRQRDNRRPRTAQGQGGGPFGSAGSPRTGQGSRPGGGQFSGNGQRPPRDQGGGGQPGQGQGGQRPGQGRRPKRGGR